MTPPTGVMFLTAMRRSAPCLEAERPRRTSILVSADAGWARLVSRVPLRPRCRKSGSVLGRRGRAPDYRLAAISLGSRGSGPLLKGVGRQPPASSLASEAYSRRPRALIRPSALSLASARSRLVVGGQAPSALGRSAAPASEASSRRSRAGTVNLSKRGVEGAPNLVRAIRRWRLSSRSRAKLQRPAHAKRGESQQW